MECNWSGRCLPISQPESVPISRLPGPARKENVNERIQPVLCLGRSGSPCRMRHTGRSPSKVDAARRRLRRDRTPEDGKAGRRALRRQAPDDYGVSESRRGGLGLPLYGRRENLRCRDPFRHAGANEVHDDLPGPVRAGTGRVPLSVFAPITPQTAKGEVERRVGRPFMTTVFPRLEEEVWDYRYMDGVQTYVAEIHFDMQGRMKYSTNYPDRCPLRPVACR